MKNNNIPIKKIYKPKNNRTFYKISNNKLKLKEKERLFFKIIFQQRKK